MDSIWYIATWLWLANQVHLEEEFEADTPRHKPTRDNRFCFLQKRVEPDWRIMCGYHLCCLRWIQVLARFPCWLSHILLPWPVLGDRCGLLHLSLSKGSSPFWCHYWPGPSRQRHHQHTICREDGLCMCINAHYFPCTNEVWNPKWQFEWSCINDQVFKSHGKRSQLG